MKISMGGGHKKELFNYHYEKVIDKPYSERKEVKMPNIFVALGLSIIPNILALGFWLFGGKNFGLLFVLMYFNFMTSMLMTHSVQEAMLNKRIFASPFLYNGIMFIVDGFFWILFINPFSNSSIGILLCVIVILGILIFIFFTFILIAWLLTIKKEKETCTMLIKAKCIGYTEELVDRYVNNHGYDKYDRVTSVAYGNSEKIVIYKPIFWFIMDGIEYNTQPNYQSSVKRFVEGDGYEIYIDPKNPNVCRIK